ncbi:MAG: hypothetical protein HQL74_04075 [Magnetococcales bacterium]|nr:hypothetical protein [Magnetococcales bacterium]
MFNKKNVTGRAWMATGLLALVASFSNIPTAAAYDREEGAEWVACIFNRDHGSREVSVTWIGERGRKEQCSASATIQPGEFYPFTCRFYKSHPRVKVRIYGHSGRVRIEGDINVAVGDGERRRCDRSNSSTIVKMGDELILKSGIPRGERHEQHQRYNRQY